MSPLSAHNLPRSIRTYTYDRDAVRAGIVHFGIGNFHRAHQAVYCDDLLNAGALSWGITGVSLRSSAMRDALKPQDYVYTLATLGPQAEYRIIGAVKNILVAPEAPQAVIDLISKDTTHLISSTITEKGYALTSGQVDFTHTDLKAEQKSLETPKTIYGFLACGIIQRFRLNPHAKLTIMCCDNISAGGDFLKHGVEHLLQRHNPKAFEWAQNNIGYISSMVDRVCPATDVGLRERVSKETQRQDAWPVSAEPFTQWVIEDNFVGTRPDFDTVGAVFINDIVPYETLKLRYLNAAHTMASTLGYLSDDIYVHEALQRPEVFNFMRRALYKNVLPHAPVPSGYNGATYIEETIKRFQNAHLPYGNLQVGTDSSQKVQQRWFPTIDHALAQNADTSYFEVCLGAWAIFIQTALGHDVLKDPKKADFQQIDTDNLEKMISSYLTIAGAEKFEFFKNAHFMLSVMHSAKAIKTKGLKAALIDFLNSQDLSHSQKRGETDNA